MRQVTLPPTALGKAEFEAINAQVLNALKQRLGLNQNVRKRSPKKLSLLLSDELFGGYIASAETLVSPIGMFYGRIQFHPLAVQSQYHSWAIIQNFERFSPVIHVNYRAPYGRKPLPLTLDEEVTVAGASRRTGRGLLLDHLVEISKTYRT